MKRETHTILMNDKKYEVVVDRDYEFGPCVKFTYYEILPKKNFFSITRRRKGRKTAFPDQIMSYSLKLLAESGLKDILAQEQYNVELNERMEKWE